jgi:hypothetical protein
MTKVFNEKDYPITWIAVKNLNVVWAEAQRPLDKKHVRQIAEGFDPDMFGTIAVTMPNGKGEYHVIDGNHRRAAVLSMWGGDQMVPCQVYAAKDPARAAKLFDRINTARRGVTAVQIFKVRVCAGEPNEVAVDRIVRDVGLYVGSTNETGRSITAVSALLAVYDGNGEEALRDVLRVLQATWGLDRNAYTSQLVRGYGAFFGKYRQRANQQRLKETVAKKFTPMKLLTTAKNARDVEGGNIATNVSRILVATYNRGAKPGQVLKDA